MLELQNISVIFPENGVKALDNASLRLEEGSVHALVGENGAGKSTLAQVSAGFLQPNTGKILLDGVQTHFHSHAQAQKHGIGMVRQHPAVVEGLSVWEDAVLGAAASEKTALPHSKSLAALKKRASELNSQWRFNLPLDAPAISLSQGQRHFSG
jgi:ABC-type uncharacterized transport system ATPase subunit